MEIISDLQELQCLVRRLHARVVRAEARTIRSEQRMDQIEDAMSSPTRMLRAALNYIPPGPAATHVEDAIRELALEAYQ